MREKQKYILITFYTTAEAMATEKLCKEQDIEGKLISAPRALTADCGIAWRSAPKFSERLKTALNDAGIEFAGFHEIMI
ncbi:MAG: DUF3343 domain-containing protein [Clostridiales bacterium]|nr:DUF3343 domain-containing protein [Clostridiales bacterium]